MRTEGKEVDTFGEFDDARTRRSAIFVGSACMLPPQAGRRQGTREISTLRGQEGAHIVVDNIVANFSVERVICLTRIVEEGPPDFSNLATPLRVVGSVTGAPLRR